LTASLRGQARGICTRARTNANYTSRTRAEREEDSNGRGRPVFPARDRTTWRGRGSAVSCRRMRSVQLNAISRTEANAVRRARRCLIRLVATRPSASGRHADEGPTQVRGSRHGARFRGYSTGTCRPYTDVTEGSETETARADNVRVGNSSCRGTVFGDSRTENVIGQHNSG